MRARGALSTVEGDSREAVGEGGDDMAERVTTGRSAAGVAGGVLLPLALAQFICSFAGSNMNVMINDMSRDLNTTVQGIQVAITLFLLVMAAFMIPGGKLTDRYGRKKCFNIGLVVYAVGALISAAAPGLPVLILGNSILEGIGTALLIPPVYILATMLFTGTTSRARAFGAINAAAGIGAATGPLIGGLIATAISWRAAFVFQALVIGLIVLLSRRSLRDPLPADPARHFDVRGAILSALGLILLVMGILAASKNLLLMLALLVAGVLVLVWFFAWVRAEERAGQEPLLSTRLFRNRTSNLGLVTQNAQWLMLMGTSFVVAAYLQVARGYNPIQTGVIFTAATIGVLISSFAAQRLAQRRAQRTLIVTGFVVDLLRHRAAHRPGPALAQRVGPRPRALRHRARRRQSCSRRRSTSCSPRSARSSRGRSPASRAACPTWAPPSARRSPARCSSPGSRPPRAGTTRWRCSWSP